LLTLLALGTKNYDSAHQKCLKPLFVDLMAKF